MLKFVISVFLIIILVGVGYKYYKGTGDVFGLDRLPFFKGSILVTSKDFVDGEPIAQKFTCQGQNVSPVFSIANVPPDTKSMAMIMEDISKPTNPVTHWLLVNLDPTTTVIHSASL